MAAFLSKKEREGIVDAIRSAEMDTSGEIRVHIEPECKGDPYLKAAYVFSRLKMFDTQRRNAVLIYLAYKSHKFAIIGDSGINELVGEGFWNDVRDAMSADFASGRFSDGLVSAILSVGRKLKDYFPYQKDDVNEQSDEISFGE
ncbi:MAG TPA: TPM domain-containing protein [Candidatus Coprenecus stercoripullorum]|nr:TPM domain-containing protein [Candidatus Coprenecus stercoripullorum]